MINYFMSLYYAIKDNLFITLVVFSFLTILYFIFDFYGFVIIGLPFLIAYICIIIQSPATGAILFMVFMFLPHYIVEFYVSKTVPPIIICGEVVDIRLVSNGGRAAREVFDLNHQNKIHTFDKESYDRFRVSDNICVQYHIAFNNRKFNIQVLKEKND